MSPQLYFTQQWETLEVDLQTFEWRQPYFCTVQKERDSHGTAECVTSEEKNRGKLKYSEKVYVLSAKRKPSKYIIFLMVIGFINNILTTVLACLNTSFLQI